MFNLLSGRQDFYYRPSIALYLDYFVNAVKKNK